MSDPNFYERLGTGAHSMAIEAMKVQYLGGGGHSAPTPSAPAHEETISMKRWSAANDVFRGASETYDELPAGLYRTEVDNYGNPLLLRQKHETDGLLELPDDAGIGILKEFDDFWMRRDEFTKRGFLQKRGFMLWGPPGCHPRGTKVIMFDGSVRDVAEVKTDDLLMGPDSKPRRVLELKSGVGKIYEVRPTKGKPFLVNEDHILALHPSGIGHALRSRFCIKVSDFLKQSKDFQLRSKLYRADAIDFGPSRHLPIPPYILGLWLGDGHSHEPALTTMDECLKEAWCEWAIENGSAIKEHRITSSKATTYSAVTIAGGARHGANPARNALRDLGVLGNKHIPHHYLTASIEDRLELLAGLIDSDGHNGGGSFDFISKFQSLSESVMFLARSLGFSAYIKSCEKGCTYRGKRKVGKFWRLCISGDCDRIPVRLARKRGSPRRQIKDHLVTGFTLHEVGHDRYYGFTLNGDHLYLLEDFTVTHNSGKTSLLNLLINRIIQNQNGVVLFLDNPVCAARCLRMLRMIEPTRPIVAIMEDLDALVHRHGEHEYLALLDGEAQVDRVVFVSTTNYPEKLDRRFCDRPSRFDTVQYIGMPLAKARKAYLQAKEPDLVGKELDLWVASTDGFSLAHLKELIIAVKCLGQPFEKAMERLESMRVARPNSEDEPTRPHAGFLPKKNGAFAQIGGV